MTTLTRLRNTYPRRARIEGMQVQKTFEQRAEEKRMFLLDHIKRVNTMCSHCRIRRHVPKTLLCRQCVEVLA